MYAGKLNFLYNKNIFPFLWNVFCKLKPFYVYSQSDQIGVKIISLKSRELGTNSNDSDIGCQRSKVLAKYNSSGTH